MPTLSLDIPEQERLNNEEVHFGETGPSLLMMIPAYIGALLMTAGLLWVEQLLPQWETWLHAMLPSIAYPYISTPEMMRLAILGIALSVIYIPVILESWALMTTRYRITSRLFHYRTGILNRDFEQIEISRIRDVRVRKPLLLRLFRHGHLLVYTVDRNNALVHMNGIREPLKMKAFLYELSKRDQARVGYREIETTSH